MNSCSLNYSKVFKNGNILNKFYVHSAFPLILQSRLGNDIQIRKYKHAKVNYYDVLNISSESNQSQVKHAYYALSKEYHPDLSTGDKTKFHLISEAYEILGDVKKRKLYDRGLSSNVASTTTAAEAKAAAERIKKTWKQSTKSRAPSQGRVKGVYDFESWNNTHFKQLQEMKRIDKMRAKTSDMKMVQSEAHSFSGGFMIVGLFVLTFCAIVNKIIS